jgi:predicted transcriptional regulator of viral defense system
MPSYLDKKANVLNLLRSERRPLRYAEVRQLMGGDVGVKRLEEEGVIERMKAGVFAEPGRDTTWDSLAILSSLHPEGIACLETAAVFHGLTDANPDAVHMAFPRSKRVPVHPDINVEGYRWSETYLVNGVDLVDIGSMRVPMTTKERTVVDFLRRMERTGMIEEGLKVMKSYFDTGGTEKDLMKAAKQIGAEVHVKSVSMAAMAMRSL